MKNVRPLLCGIPVFALALSIAAPAARAAGVPAISAFDQAFSKVNDYTVTVKAHEVSGSHTQNRTYNYWFKRPDKAKTLIVDGDGKGSGGVWNGGDSVSGHQGGFLAFIHLKVSIHDPRATSLRGYTIPEGLIQNEVDKYKDVKGDLTQKAGPAVDGAATDEVDLNVADPAQNQGVTRMIIYFNRETHFPVRQLRYAGDQIVADETFANLKTNVGLTDGDFPF
ncbi:MAG TPA: hypothetical protein VGZ02_02900 [Candidatus Baltobacteraceae bacterium]|jgi:outer membrane lipoprotein-sorting protein|nr:hypothetical protein [Candidatus Baltobacteraceae bacterium]